MNMGLKHITREIVYFIGKEGKTVTSEIIQKLVQIYHSTDCARTVKKYKKFFSAEFLLNKFRKEKSPTFFLL